VLWQSLGVELGYFDEAEAQPVMRALSGVVFDSVYEWLGPWKGVHTPAAIDWLLGMREEGLRRRDVRRYNQISTAASEALQTYFQAGLLLAGRSTSARASEDRWTAHVMYADDEAWQSIIARFEGESRLSDADRDLGDGATGVLTYMNACLETLNAAAQDERINDLERQQFSSDLGLLLTWPLNLEAAAVSRRFSAFVTACIARTQREHSLSEAQSSRVRQDVLRITDAWRESVGAGKAVGHYA
jgi:hypothetical protein